MSKMIRNIYAKMVQESCNTEKIDKDMQEEILDLLKDEEKRLDAESYNQLRDNTFLIASIAEENGFVKGFRYAFWLFMECVWK